MPACHVCIFRGFQTVLNSSSGKELVKKANNYLDDFFFVVLLQALCNNQVDVICDEIGFCVVPEKNFDRHSAPDSINTDCEKS